MSRTIFRCALAGLLLTGSGAVSFAADKLSPEDLAFFENKIRPVLVKHCFECHSATADEIGGKLRLDTPEGVQAGGESGPLFSPNTAEKSVLLQALRYEEMQMPPDAPLSEAIINDFAKWVRRGAPFPQPAVPAKPVVRKKPIESSHWAFHSPQKPTVPTVTNNDWPRRDIDRFALSRMEKFGLSPGVDADPRTLARRLYYDLIGLPPTFQEVQQFESDHKRDSSTAIENLVDDLLSRPQFGERWGRHWLDVARYGESNGNDGLGRNPTFPHAWRYRDYVVESFNQDTPYDRFLTEQIAGDLIETDSPEERDRNLVATGFLAMTAKPAKAMNKNFDMDVVADQIDVVTRGVMGISVACARCHDHKFDPIPIDDYYALAGFFTSTETLWGPAANEKLTAPPTDLHVLEAADDVPPPEDFVETVLVLESNTGKPKAIPKPKWPEGTPLAMGVRDRKEPKDCKIHIKGDVGKLGDVIPRGFLSVCQSESSSPIEVNGQQSGRLELAQWLTQPDHPLTSRVMVNRVWHHLFGRGLVSTVDEFGLTGEAPTHPELLDYLAVQFVERGWSIKQLIREIVLSRTYQLSSDSSWETTGEETTLLAIHKRRRLDAEALRDAMLSASGHLDLTPADGSIIRHRDILVNLAGSLHEPSNKRSLYLCYLRNSPPPELSAFDLPDFSKSVGKRGSNTIPDQALFLFNNPFVIEQSTNLGQSLLAIGTDDTQRIQALWQRAFQRVPTQSEVADVMEFLQSSRSERKSEESVWMSLCQAVLASNEFRYID